MFSCEFCEISKNNFFAEHLWTTASNHFRTIKSLKNENIRAVQDFTDLGSSIASTKRDIDIKLGKASSALNKLDVIWKSSLPANLKRSYFQATNQFLCMELHPRHSQNILKKLLMVLTRECWAVLNISWKQYPTKNEPYDNIMPINLTMRDRNWDLMALF